MKTLLTLILATLLFSYSQTSAVQNDFTLKLDKDTITITAGETATFNLDFIIQNGFDASIFLALKTGALQGVLSSGLVNFPYTRVKLTVKTTAYYTPSGIYDFHIDGWNGSLSSSVQCQVIVKPVPRSNWRIIPLTNLLQYPRPEFVFQDTKGYYWHNLRGMHRENSDTPLEKWGLTKSNTYSYTSFPPVIDYMNNKIWLANTTYGGIIKTNLDGSNITAFNDVDNPILYNVITTFAINNSNNDVWIGTTKGLTRLTGKVWTNFDLSNSKLDKELITSIILSGSIVWIGTTNGLVRYDGTGWTRFTPQNSLMPARLAKVLAVEANGDLWVGLSGDASISNLDYPYFEPTTMIGLAKFDGTNWTLYNSKNSPLHESNYVNAVAIDKKGNKWIATASHLKQDKEGFDTIYGGAGLLKFDNTTWTAYTKANSPLPYDYINWVNIDNDDNVWFHQFQRDYDYGFWGVFNESGLPAFLAPPVGVEELPLASDAITITPNPSSTTITINGTDNISAVTIVNSFGMEVVGRQTLSSANGSLNVDVSDLASGVYFVQLRTPTGMISKPIVVMH